MKIISFGIEISTELQINLVDFSNIVKATYILGDKGKVLSWVIFGRCSFLM